MADPWSMESKNYESQVLVLDCHHQLNLDDCWLLEGGVAAPEDDWPLDGGVAAPENDWPLAAAPAGGVAAFR